MTMKAQSLNWFQAFKIKIRPKAFLLPPTTPKKSRNMSLFFWVGIFFLWHLGEAPVDLFIAQSKHFSSEQLRYIRLNGHRTIQASDWFDGV
jgi:hypothetical protein